MAITEWYTGDGGNDSTGDGTSHATRWLTIQKALDTMTTGQPNRLNIRGLTTAEGGWDFSTYGIPVQDNFLVFQGYDATAGDGVVAAIDGGTSEIITNDALDAINFRDLKFNNWGTGTAFSLDNWISFINCEFDGEGSRTKVIDADVALQFINCKVHGIALTGSLLVCAGGSHIFGNYFQIDSATASDVILDMLTTSTIAFNVLSLKTTASCIGIGVSNDDCLVLNNTIFNQSAGTGEGIKVSSAGSEGTTIFNNIVAGFSGTGGVGIENVSGSVVRMYGNNKFWNNSTNDTMGGETIMDLGNNSALGSSPFTSTGNADHNNDDFTVDTTVKGAGFPTELYDPDDTQATRNQQFIDCGALQREEPAGGGSASGARNPLVGPIG